MVSGFRKNKNSPLANFAALLLALENPMLFSDLISLKLWFFDSINSTVPSEDELSNTIISPSILSKALITL